MSKDLASPVLKRSKMGRDLVSHYEIEGGMTKREVFAAHIMTGLATVYYADTGVYPETVARSAVALADALIAELEKTK